MKTIIREFGGAVIAALVAGLLMLVVCNVTQEIKKAAIPVAFQGILQPAPGAKVFDANWRGI